MDLLSAPWLQQLCVFLGGVGLFRAAPPPSMSEVLSDEDWVAWVVFLFKLFSGRAGGSGFSCLCTIRTPPGFNEQSIY